MASLTPLSKSLIGLVVLGGMASAVWHLALKDRLSGTSDQPVKSNPVPNGTAEQPVLKANIAAPALGASTPTSTLLSVAENAETGRRLMDAGNYAQARTYLQAAVQAGHGPSACLLGEMTIKGQGGQSADQEQAAKLFQLAQSRGSICFAPGQ